MIWLDNCTAVPSPSYHVQKLFMNHHGDVVLAQEISEKGPSVMMSRYPDSLPGDIVLEANESRVAFENHRGGHRKTAYLPGNRAES